MSRIKEIMRTSDDEVYQQNSHDDDQLPWLDPAAAVSAASA